jgi:hypothetical protein
MVGGGLLASVSLVVLAACAAQSSTHQSQPRVTRAATAQASTHPLPGAAPTPVVEKRSRKRRLSAAQRARIPTFAPMSLAMVSPEVGFVWGFRSRGFFKAADEHAELARTDDGGRTWRIVPGTPKASYSGNAIGDVTFVSPSIGYLWGSKIFQTIDGGVHWRRLHVPHAIGELSGSDGYAWASSSTCRNCLKQTVFRIDPDGRVEHRDLPDAPVNLDDGLGASSDGVQTLFTGDKDGHVKLWLQGLSGGWVRRTTPCDWLALDKLGPDAQIDLMCLEEPGTGFEPTHAWVSYDDGETWSPRRSPGEAGYPSDLEVSGNNWVLSRFRGSIQTSLGGSQPWQYADIRPHTDFTGGEGFGEMYLSSDGAGVAIPSDGVQGETRLAYTTDYGQHWTARKIRLG